MAYICGVAVINFALSFVWCVILLLALERIDANHLRLTFVVFFTVVTLPLVAFLGAWLNFSMIEWATAYERFPRFPSEIHFKFLRATAEKIYMPASAALSSLLVVTSHVFFRLRQKVSAYSFAVLAALCLVVTISMGV